MPQPYVLIPANGSDPADEWVRLGMESQLVGQGLAEPLKSQKFAAAEGHYRHALRLDPRHAVACQNLAVLFAQVGNVNEALLTVERATMFDPKLVVAHVNRAFMNLEADRIDEALDAAIYAVSVSVNGEKPEERAGYVNSRLSLAMIYATAGHPAKAVPLYREILAVEPGHPVANPNVCFVQTLTNATPQELLAQRQVWYAANKYDGKYSGPTKAYDSRVGGTLRVGYVGGDFKRHSAAMIFGNVVLNHTDAVEVYLYSSLPVNPDADPQTKLFMDKVGDRWRDISALSDEQADELIRKDGIDILVDLAAHTGGGRLALFCRKPAPVQVTGWGYAHGTGVPEMDYFFADPVAVREEERVHYAERIYDLPCVVTYNPPEYDIKGKSALPYFQNDYVTFGSYARYEKLSDECLDTFAEILRRVPDSRLEFKDHAFRRPYSIRRVLSRMPDIAPERLLFSISTTHPDHMLAYQQADIALDPFPHGGGVVALEQLYMGVPIITLYGTQAAGRSATSILAQLGRTDWIARSPAEYVEAAVRLANDVPQMNKARKTLRDELLSSPVVKGYCGKVEEAYRAMWKDWCEK